jgi:hypothetical protein
MKKTYIEPKTEILAADVCEELMAGSAPYSDTPATPSGTGVDDVTPEAGTQGLARKTIDAWDEW